VSQGAAFSKRERRLGGERRAEALGDRLQRRVGTKKARVVGILVPGGDLVDPLAQQRQQVVGHVPAIAGLGHRLAERGGQPQPLVELADQEEARVARDLAAVEGDRELPLETEAELSMTPCSHRHLPAVCRRLVSTTASLAHLERAGGFFTLVPVNYPG